MPSRTPNRASCSTHEQWVARELSGELLTGDNQDALHKHRSECASCRTDEGAARLLRYDDEQAPLPPLDDLQAQRLIATVVQGADASAEVPHRKVRRRSMWVGITAAMVLLFSGSALVYWLTRPGSAPPLSGGTPPASIQLLLDAGPVPVLIDGHRVAVGHGIMKGQVVRVDSGRAVLGLPDGGRALLGPHAVLRVQSLHARRVVLNLERGEVLVRIPPGPKRRRFEVATPKGRVVVTGTVFRVRVDANRVTVAVLRGRVQVLEKGNGARQVGWGQATYLNAGSGPRLTWALSVGARNHLKLQLNLVIRLEAPRPTRLAVRSRPPGARVMLGHTELGLTPLTALVKPGHYLLSVRREGYAVSTEHLSLMSGGKVTRSLVLHRLKERATITPTQNKPQSTPNVTPPTPTPTPTPTQTTRPTPTQTPRRPAATRLAPRVARLTARELLVKARQRAISQDFSGAAQAYRQLIKHHRSKPQAVAARVSLALILIDRLSDPLGALHLFAAYLILAPTGPLAPEAAYGRIRAVRRLGRRASEITAIRIFLQRFPKALQYPTLKRRLRRLQRHP